MLTTEAPPAARTEPAAASRPGTFLLAGKPLALVVFLENVGHVASLRLPSWVTASIDYLTEEYAKLLLRLYGAYSSYEQIVILEDARATGPQLADALLTVSRTHTVDLLLLVHGHTGLLVGHRGQQLVGDETFAPLRAARQQEPATLDLRMVYGLNCYGLTLAPTWLALGAQAVNGAVGVNWFPEPSLSIFLRRWLAGAPYSEAVVASNVTANRWWRRILRSDPAGPPHPWIVSSQQVVFGQRDLRIDA